jgi:hypothetical protein
MSDRSCATCNREVCDCEDTSLREQLAIAEMVCGEGARKIDELKASLEEARLVRDGAIEVQNLLHIEVASVRERLARATELLRRAHPLLRDATDKFWNLPACDGDPCTCSDEADAIAVRDAVRDFLFLEPK